MKPHQLRDIIQSRPIIYYAKGDMFHSLDFSQELYVVKTGFAKRYSVSQKNTKAIESIYGPNYFFPLSPVIKNLFDYDLNQDTNTYVYQAMTDIELQSISSDELLSIVKVSPIIYSDLLFETARRLKVDIDRLTSNALKNDHLKTVHQLVCLAEEFGELNAQGISASAVMPLPIEPIDLAEQLNLEESIVAASLSSLNEQGLIKITDHVISIPDISLLKDEYLRG